MAGGPSTPELAIAVCEAGGLGFVAAGYKRADVVRAEIQAVRQSTNAPFGVNLFVPAPERADSNNLQDYLHRLKPEAERQGAELGEPRFDDDDWAAKLEVMYQERPAVTSFTFGCPDESIVNRLHGVDTAVWVTVTNVAEALAARESGADGLVVQGSEAGGHRGGFIDDGSDEGGIGLLALLRTVAGAMTLPLIATGGVADGAGLAAVLCAGASAAQIGTALMLAPEAGTAGRPAKSARRAPPDARDAGVHRARRLAGSSTGSWTSTARLRRSPIRRSITSRARSARPPAGAAMPTRSTCGRARLTNWRRPGRPARSCAIWRSRREPSRSG